MASATLGENAAKRPVGQKTSSFMPGYSGYCPMVKYSDGISYGRATQRFWDYTRNESLNTSVISPTRRNSYSGEGVILSRRASQGRPGSTTDESRKWLTPTPYLLTHTGRRRDEIIKFGQDGQKHRVQYKDHTGGVSKMYDFSYHPRRHSEPALSYSLGYPAKVLGGAKTFTFTSPTKKLKWENTGDRRGSANERMKRDYFFERR